MEYDKLVRDRIPEIIAENGGTCEVRKVKGEEYSEYLYRKLDEEVAEFKVDHNPEELADILEVVFALAADQGIDEDEIGRIRCRKRELRGGFEKGLVLKRTSTEF